MFCVLELNFRNQTFFEKMFGRFLKDEYTLSTIPVFKGAPFYLLNVCTGKRGVDWERVVLNVGKCASRLVVNCETEIPQNMNIGIYKSDKLYDKMMKNTFLYVLEKNIDKKNLSTISILDTEGKYVDFVQALTKYSSSMTITTNAKEKYYDVCEKITDNTGLCPVFAGEFVDSVVKINADENIMTVRQNRDVINISSGDDFVVPSMYENLLPGDISKYDFFSALYELCGVFSLSECIFNTLLVNNEKKNVNDIHFT